MSQWSVCKYSQRLADFEKREQVCRTSSVFFHERVKLFMRTRFHVVRQASLNNLCKLTNEKTVLDVQKSRFGRKGMFEVIKDPNSRYFELKQNDELAEILKKSTSKKKKKIRKSKKISSVL